MDIAAWLAEHFEECVAERSFDVVVLRSPTGWGKTNEVEAMYATLASAQALPRYWPDDFGVATRKRIYPASFRPTAGARIPFVWWGLQGELGADGQPRFGGYEVNGQLEAILQPLATAIGSDERLWRDRALTVLRAATSLTAVTVLPVGETVRTVKLLTDIAGEVLELVPQMIGEIRGGGVRTERARRAQGGSTLRTDDAAQARAAAERAGSILAAVSHVVPTVVAVEDAQYLDDHSVTMLRSWVRSELPVGVLVLTIATDRPGPGQQWRAWFDELLRSNRVTIIDLDPLPDEHMKQIVLERLNDDRPGYAVHLETVAELALLAAGNPLTLHNLLDQPAILDALITGDIDALRAVATRPPAPNSGLQTAFDSFDQLTQQSLAILSILGQATARSWFDAALRTGLDSIVDRAQALDAVTNCGWCEETADGEIAFLDAGCYRIATRAVPDLIDDQRRTAVLDRLHALIEATRTGSSWTSLPSRVRQEAIQSLLARPGTSPNEIAVLSLELHEIYLATGQAERRRRRLDLMQQQLRLVTRSIADQLVVTIGSGLLELGQTQSALRIFHDEHQQQARARGDDDPETLIALHNLAVALRTSGQPEAAVTTFTDLLHRRLTVLPAHHPHIRGTRRDLAVTLANQGRHIEARQQLQALHDDNLATLGADHPESISDDIQLAQVTTRAGSPSTAIALLEGLIVRAEQLFGQHHEIVRHATYSLAEAYQAIGRLAEARQLYQTVLVTDILVLGRDHPDTLTTRNNLAGLRGELNDIGTAIAEYEEIVSTRERVLGPDHPDTLAARNNLAHWRGRAGDPTAAAEFERLLTDLLRVLGPNHPTTLAARSNHAGWRGQAGDADAVAEFEQLLIDHERVLGPDHPDTLNARDNLAGLRGKSGDTNGAIADLEQLLTDRERLLGSDHPDTLTTRNNLAGMRGQSGNAVGAAAEFTRLLADQRRVLGPDHIETLTTRNNLAGVRGQAGDIDGAVADLEELLADRKRVLGPDHPDTLTTRSNLAYWRGKANMTDAVAESKRVLDDLLRTMGPDHPHSLTARNNFATALGEASQIKAAIAEFEQLLLDLIRVLGPNHPRTLVTRNNLISWRANDGDVTNAVVESERLLEDFIRVLGPNHPHTIGMRINLADWRGQDGNVAAAIAELEQLLIDAQRHFGPNHPSLISISNNLAYWRGQVA